MSDKLLFVQECAIDFQHLNVEGPDGNLQPKMTVAYIRTATRTAVGVAFCSPKDNPNKKIGRSIALGRAKAALAGESRPINRYEPMRTLLRVKRCEEIRTNRHIKLIHNKAFEVKDPTFRVATPKPRPLTDAADVFKNVIDLGSANLANELLDKLGAAGMGFPVR